MKTGRHRAACHCISSRATSDASQLRTQTTAAAHHLAEGLYTGRNCCHAPNFTPLSFKITRFGVQDLYVMRRAVGVYERIIRRFTAQDTDYQLLLSTFAEGLYTEMDFRNEALNMERMTMLMQQSDFGGEGVIIPKPFMDRTTRWVPCFALLSFNAPLCSVFLLLGSLHMGQTHPNWKRLEHCPQTAET